MDGRLRWDHADRVWLAALSRLVSRCRWAKVFPVASATILRWHRHLVARLAGAGRRPAEDEVLVPGDPFQGPQRGLGRGRDRGQPLVPGVERLPGRERGSRAAGGKGRLVAPGDFLGEQGAQDLGRVPTAGPWPWRGPRGRCGACAAAACGAGAAPGSRRAAAAGPGRRRSHAPPAEAREVDVVDREGRVALVSVPEPTDGTDPDQAVAEIAKTVRQIEKAAKRLDKARHSTGITWLQRSLWALGGLGAAAAAGPAGSAWLFTALSGRDTAKS